jgi:hypothetical protein
VIEDEVKGADDDQALKDDFEILRQKATARVTVFLPLLNDSSRRSFIS